MAAAFQPLEQEGPPARASSAELPGTPSVLSPAWWHPGHPRSLEPVAFEGALTARERSNQTYPETDSQRLSWQKESS